MTYGDYIVTGVLLYVLIMLGSIAIFAWSLEKKNKRRE